jgi:hypothetical protein
MRRSFALAALAAIVLFAVVHVVQRPSPDTPVMAVTASEDAGSVPSPEYLFEHPDTLKAAEQQCRAGAPSSVFCSNVHRAESLRLADQYRRALKPSGAAR